MDKVKVGKMADQIIKAILDSGDMEHEEVASAIVQALMRRASDADRKRVRLRALTALCVASWVLYGSEWTNV